MTRREISEAISSTNWLNIIHVTFASEIARGCQVDLEWLACIAAKNGEFEKSEGHTT